MKPMPGFNVCKRVCGRLGQPVINPVLFIAGIPLGHSPFGWAQDRLVEAQFDAPFACLSKDGS